VLEMRREISNRTIALIAICLAVGSSLFCWGLTQRSSRIEETRERNIVRFENDLDQLRYELINVGALLLKSSEMPSRSGRMVPTDSRLSARYCDLGSSPTLFQTFETVRANDFLVWYYQQMKKLHQLERDAR